MSAEGRVNVAVLLTPAGAGAIAVVRVSGGRVREFLCNHFSKPAAVGRCVHGDLADGPRVIDDAVVVVRDETTADLNVHGGAWVVRSVLELAGREGFEVLDAWRMPLPAEAVDGGTALSREVQTHLPLARTELGLRVLLSQEAAWAALKRRAERDPTSVREELDRIAADATLDHLLRPPTVAIVGPANVGKSTLANRLFAQERSITADVPGTTRDWVGEVANLDGLAVMLLDTPGVRETSDPIESAAIERSRARVAGSELVVLVLDATRPLAGEQAGLMDAYPGAVVVVNKCDQRAADDFSNLPAARTVATRGEGVDDLRSSIAQFFCGEWPLQIDRARCWTRRQRGVLASALASPTAIRDI